MVIDDNELEIEAMALFRRGDGAAARKLQDRFLPEVFDSGEDYCPCPEACKHHGTCIECVTVHRGHGDHLPFCLQAMVNRRLAVLSELSEHSFKALSE